MTNFFAKRTWGPTPRYDAVRAWPTPRRGTRDAVMLPKLIILAGPCSVESPEQADLCLAVLRQKDLGVTYVRGGLYRAGTYPRADGVFGLQTQIVEWWAEKVRAVGKKTIIEVLDIRQVEYLDRYADAFQVGARHCQDYALLRELAQSEKLVTLKRGMGMTLDEFLGAAEYLAQGRCTPILIERGSATHMNHVRWDLSVSLIAAVKRMTSIPILVDASHGTGRRDLVEPMTLAGLAAGADGFLVEVHPDPERSLSDADQALSLESLAPLRRKAVRVMEAML